MDTIRITTSQNGARNGLLLSSEYESKPQNEYSTYRESVEAHFSYKSSEVSLFNVETIEDGDYPLSRFTRVPIAASFVLDGEPAPLFKGNDCYFYNLAEDDV